MSVCNSNPKISRMRSLSGPQKNRKTQQRKASVQGCKKGNDCKAKKQAVAPNEETNLVIGVIGIPNANHISTAAHSQSGANHAGFLEHFSNQSQQLYSVRTIATKEGNAGSEATPGLSKTRGFLPWHRIHSPSPATLYSTHRSFCGPSGSSSRREGRSVKEGGNPRQGEHKGCACHCTKGTNPGWNSTHLPHWDQSLTEHVHIAVGWQLRWPLQVHVMGPKPLHSVKSAQLLQVITVRPVME